jgi:spore coat polysaccharide biosynthesis protein SpsF
MGPRAVKIVATIEARMTSTRLPGKVLADVGGEPSLAVMIGRLKLVPEIDEIVVATTRNETDDAIAVLASECGVGVWRGSEDDVLQRVLEAAQHHEADVIVELTGDCPLIDPAIVSRVIRHYDAAGVDYVSNILERTYPIGMDTQVFKTSVLADVARRTSDRQDHEHVSLYIYRHPEIYSLSNVTAPPAETHPALRLTLDTKEDLIVLRAVHEALCREGRGYPLARILAFLDANPDVRQANERVAHRWV